MTVSTAPTPLSYSGDGSTTDFPITWKYNAKSHVVATLRSSSGSETTWVLSTNYTLTDPGDSGTLTATAAPASGETLVITLEPPNTQASNFPLGGDFASTNVESGLDLAAQRDAYLLALINRSLRVPKTDSKSGSSLEIPIDTLRASKFLAFDADGDPIAAAGTSADLGPVTSFVNTLLDDVNADSLMQTVIAALTAETAPAVDDVIIIGDTSESKGNKMTVANFFKSIDTLTADTSPDNAADEVVTFDASASAAKKVALVNLTAGPAATQAQQEAGSATNASVTPAVQQHHKSACKAWIDLEPTATPAINGSYNFTSVTDSGTGYHTPNFTTAFSSVNYAVVCGREEAGESQPTRLLGIFAKATGSCGLVSHQLDTNAAAIRTDEVYNSHAAFFGDQ